MRESRDEILARFRALGIKVTDDFDKVQAAIKKLEPMQERARESPDKFKAAEGEMWFETVQPLRNRQKLQEYVEALQKDFWKIADKMIGATRDEKIQLAKDDFNFDDDLAKKTVESGEIRPDDPEPVFSLNTRASPDCVKLTWSLPSEKCEAIRVERVDAGKHDQRKVLWGAQKPWMGLCAGCTDREVQPGKGYRYTVYSVFGGRTNMNPAEIEVVVPEEPRNPRAQFKAVEGEPCVDLTWEKPALCRQVMIFRRIGSRPTISDEQHPQPGDPATTKLNVGGQPLWVDKAGIEDGKDHYYVFVADFGDAAFSKGVTVVAHVPQRPAPVQWVQPEYDGKTNTLTLTWASVARGGPVDYVIVRGEGDSPPQGISSGKVARTKESRLEATDVEPGLSYTYAVFSERDNLLSRKAACSGRIDVLAEVLQVRAEVSDKCVELSWKLPERADNVEEVLVLRGEKGQLPRIAEDSSAVRIPCGRSETLRDTGVQNGILYNYLVCCRYRMCDGRVVFSKGVTQNEVVAKEAPPAIVGLRPERGAGVVHVTHEAVPHGAHVQIYCIPDALPRWSCGQVLKTADLQALGEPITPLGPVSAVDETPNPEHIYYLPVTVEGIQARVGQVRRLPLQDVEDLKAFVWDGDVRLRWKWPEGCQTVRVVWRVGAKPEGPTDPAAASWEVSRVSYDQDGESTPGRHRGEFQDVWYIVYAMIGRELSPGDSRGCCCSVRVTPQPQLEYRLVQSGRKLKVEWKVDHLQNRFGGFVIRAKEGHRPLNQDDGDERMRVVPDADAGDGPSEWKQAVVLLPTGKTPVHLRLFLLERGNYARVRVLNLAGSGLAATNGRFHLPWPGRQTVKRRGAKDIVCPHCFQTFPRWKLHFRYEDTAPREGETSTSQAHPDTGQVYPLPGAFWARLYPFYRMPQDMPRGPDGRRFHDKVCPDENCREATPRPLPFTAGLQKCFILGLVGWSGVGKTHYVVSLVKRLQAERPMNCLDDVTQRRYSELEERLYVKKDQLHVTQTSEQALIYSLTPDSVGRQSCTLALYDTAGEPQADGKNIAASSPYLKQADGLILVLDPLQLPALAHRLGGRAGAVPATQVLTTHMGFLRRQLGILDQTKKIPTPLAVVFMKADVLCDAGLINAECLWHLPVFHKRYYNLQLHEDVDATFGELVRQYDVGLFNMIVGNFREYAFFGVSATGCAARDGKFPRVAPIRVEDPVLWLLHRFGMIEGH